MSNLLFDSGEIASRLITDKLKTACYLSTNRILVLIPPTIPLVRKYMQRYREALEKVKETSISRVKITAKLTAKPIDNRLQRRTLANKTERNDPQRDARRRPAQPQIPAWYNNMGNQAESAINHMQEKLDMASILKR